ncbi:unnamed protein product [Pylaiella littoralis]
MEDFECGKKTRRKLRLNEVKNVQVDTTDPIETAFTSGQFGHGSRVFAKVVETVIARLETRIAGAGGERAVAAAVAGKVNKAWRETYNGPLPSEARVQQELMNFSRREIRPSHSGEEVGPMSNATNLGNSILAASSGRWYAAASLPQTSTTTRKRRQTKADRRPKRRFVLKVAKSKNAGGIRQSAAGRSRTTRRPSVAAAANVNNNTGGGKQDASAAGIPERIAEGVRAGAISTTSGAPPAAAAGATSAAAVGRGRSEGGDGSGGGVELEKRAAAAKNGGSSSLGGAEPREEKEATGDSTVRPIPASSSVSSTTTTGATTLHVEGTGRGNDPLREEEIAGRGRRDTEGENGKRGSGTQLCGGGETGAEEKKIDESDADNLKDASPVVEGGEGGTPAAPDVILTANYVGEFRKGRTRQTWKLDLEGGAIEGKGQVFVFDKCECWVTPPSNETVRK